jgi:hypothetical protein
MYIKDVYLYLMITVSSSDIAKILLKVALNIHPNRGQSFKHVLIFIDKGYENVSMIIVLSPCVSLVGIDAKDNNIIFLLRRV